MLIGVTGGIGTGKSTVSKLLALSLQAERVDSDELCRLQLLPGAPGMEALIKAFGRRFTLDDGSLNKEALREALFSDREIKKQVESILHPVVRERLRYLKGCAAQNGGYVVAEVPLLFEVGWAGDFDTVVVVKTTKELAIKRTRIRDGLRRMQIVAIMENQMNLKNKIEFFMKYPGEYFRSNFLDTSGSTHIE